MLWAIDVTLPSPKQRDVLHKDIVTINFGPWSNQNLENQQKNCNSRLEHSGTITGVTDQMFENSISCRNFPPGVKDRAPEHLTLHTAGGFQ